MARIRSIKPTFWSDEKIAKLTHGCMAFFIGLWNFCDDEGKCCLNPRQLSLWMPVFRSKDILTWVRQLSELGLVRVSVCSQWVLITNWSHQRINRPVPTKIKNEEIQWHETSHSLNFDEDSLSAHCKDRIGKDRIGKDRIGGDVKGEINTKEKTQKTSPLPHLILIDLWNQHCGKLPKVSKTNPTRVKSMKARWSEEPNEEYWIGVISKIRESKFCNGENERGWLANFDFLLKPDTHIKAGEGQYESREGKKNRPLTYAEVRSQSNMELLDQVLKGEL